MDARVVLFIFCLREVLSQYEVPVVNLQALSPKGFRAWINHDSRIKLFAFQGNINSAIHKNDVGILSGEITQAKDGKWVYENTEVQLKIGDVINYYVFIFLEKTGYVKDGLSFTVLKLESPNNWLSQCELSVTKMRGKKACASEIIFEDEFDSLDEGKWQIEQYIPKNHPEYPFVSYQKLNVNPTVQVMDGYLHISAKLQDSLPEFSSTNLYSNTLNLFQGCTAQGEFCIKEASGADIIPPIISGRITSKAFAFTYGTVYVRAKMPKGDWLYPEILIEPVLKKYGGTGFNSGVMKIAAARGNTNLFTNTSDYSNKVLYGGPIMDSRCHDNFLKQKRNAFKSWGDDFHLFAMKWSPDGITLIVDGEEWGHVGTDSGSLRDQLPNNCDIPRSLLSMGSKMAPFDDLFYLTLGLTAGGVTDFPDNSFTINPVTTANYPKPWKNGGKKAMWDFWQDRAWFSTWSQPELVIDSIRVVAL